jgi:hypothetical protein
MGVEAGMVFRALPDRHVALPQNEAHRDRDGRLERRAEVGRERPDRAHLGADDDDLGRFVGDGREETGQSELVQAVLAAGRREVGRGELCTVPTGAPVRTASTRTALAQDSR